MLLVQVPVLLFLLLLPHHQVLALRRRQGCRRGKGGTGQADGAAEDEAGVAGQLPGHHLYGLKLGGGWVEPGPLGVPAGEVGVGGEVPLQGRPVHRPQHKDLPGQRRRKCDEGDEVKRDGEVRGGVVRRSLGWVASRGGESREVTSVREERR